MSALNGSSNLQEGEVSLRDYFKIIRRRWVIIGEMFLITLGLAVGWSLATPRIYRASTTVTTDPVPPFLLTDKSGNSIVDDQTAGPPPDVSTLIELVQSVTVRESAIARLTPVWGSDVAARSLKRMSVQQVGTTELVRIMVEDEDPRAAAAVANAVTESLIGMNLNARRERAMSTRLFIADQLADAVVKLRASEEALVSSKETHRNISLAEETTLNLNKLANLQAQRVDLGLQRQETEARLRAARGRLNSQARLAPTQWLPSPLIATLQSQLATLEIELSGLRGTFTPAHPQVISTIAKIAETKRRLKAELDRSLEPGLYSVDPVYQQLFQQVRQDEVGLAAMDARGRALRAAIGDYEAEVLSLPAREVELARLVRNAKEAEEIYLLLSQRLQETRIAEASIGSGIRRVDVATIPERPVKPRRGLNTMLGAILGLVLGGGLGFLAEHLDDKPKSMQEVERLLNVPVLGSIPITRGRRRSRNDSKSAGPPLRISENGKNPQAVEAYRALRTHILLWTPDVKHKCFLVTSALPDEGKSAVLANIAVTLARAERRVWLVDSDLRNSTLTATFPEAASSSGLTSFLAGRAQIDEIVRPTLEPYLWFIPSGPAVADPTELLTSPRLARLIEEARSRADLILLDSPPVLAVTDAELLGVHTEGTLMVIRMGTTERRGLGEAHQRLARAGVRVVGAVLNFVPAALPEEHSHHFYPDLRSAEMRGDREISSATIG